MIQQSTEADGTQKDLSKIKHTHFGSTILSTLLAKLKETLFYLSTAKSKK